MRSRVARVLASALLAGSAIAVGNHLSTSPVLAVNCGGGAGQFWEYTNLNGASLSSNWGANMPTMPAGWNDRISSLQTTGMPDGCGVRIYKGANYSGDTIRYCGNVTRLTLQASWNDNISSIKYVSDCPI